MKRRRGSQERDYKFTYVVDPDVWLVLKKRGAARIPLRVILADPFTRDGFQLELLVFTQLDYEYPLPVLTVSHIPMHRIVMGGHYVGVLRVRHQKIARDFHRGVGRASYIQGELHIGEVILISFEGRLHLPGSSAYQGDQSLQTEKTRT
jgi:hypothetical protein